MSVRWYPWGFDEPPDNTPRELATGVVCALITSCTRRLTRARCTPPRCRLCHASVEGGNGTAGPAKAVCGKAESSWQAGPWTAITPGGRAAWRGWSAVLARWGGRWRVGWLARPSYPR
jgi:hypothetical protein